MWAQIYQRFGGGPESEPAVGPPAGSYAAHGGAAADFRQMPAAAWTRLHGMFGQHHVLKGRLIARLHKEQTGDSPLVAPGWHALPAVPGVDDTGIDRHEELAALEREQRLVRKALKSMKGPGLDLSRVHERAYEVRQRIRELRGG